MMRTEGSEVKVLMTLKKFYSRGSEWFRISELRGSVIVYCFLILAVFFSIPTMSSPTPTGYSFNNSILF